MPPKAIKLSYRINMNNLCNSPHSQHPWGASGCHAVPIFAGAGAPAEAVIETQKPPAAPEMPPKVIELSYRTNMNNLCTSIHSHHPWWASGCYPVSWWAVRSAVYEAVIDTPKPPAAPEMTSKAIEHSHRHYLKCLCTSIMPQDRW